MLLFRVEYFSRRARAPVGGAAMVSVEPNRQNRQDEERVGCSYFYDKLCPRSLGAGPPLLAVLHRLDDLGLELDTSLDFNYFVDLSNLCSKILLCNGNFAVGVLGEKHPEPKTEKKPTRTNGPFRHAMCGRFGCWRCWCPQPCPPFNPLWSPTENKRSTQHSTVQYSSPISLLLLSCVVPSAVE